MSDNETLYTEENETEQLQETEEMQISDIDDDKAGTPPIRTKSATVLDLFDFLETLIIAACAIMLIFSFVARLTSVNGSSMIGTLEHGDKLIVSDLFYSPAQGDIIVFQDAKNAHPDYRTAVVKRIIAVGGQTVDLRYTQSGNLNLLTVSVNGEVLDEPYRYYDEHIIDELKYKYTEPYSITVPEGCVFVMGDNTYNSEDSRGGIFGCIHEDKILGRVVFRICGENITSIFSSKFGFVA